MSVPVRRSTVALSAVTALLAVACASPAGTPTAPPATPAGSPSVVPSASPSAAPSATLLVEVTSEGGFINSTATLAALPTVDVDTDGRIYTPGFVDQGAPGGLVTPVEVRDVGPAGARAIADAIHAAGLDVEQAGEGGISADTGDTVFTVDVDGRLVTNRFAGLGGGPGAGGPGGPGGPGDGPGASADPARGAALDLLNRLLDPAERWGGTSSPAVAYAPVGYRVFAAPADASAGSSSVAWPLATPLAEFGAPAVPDRGIAGLRSATVLGPDASTLAATLATASGTTTFTSGGQAWTLYVRSLLPDELGG